MAGSYDFEEQERIASIQHWWEDNAKFVYAAVAAFILSIGGWKGWQYWSATQTADAAAMSAELLRARGDAKKSADLASALIDKHPGTFFASEAALRVCDRAARILASYGYATDYDVERYLRDVRFTLIGGGTSEILMTHIARGMLK